MHATKYIWSLLVFFFWRNFFENVVLYVRKYPHTAGKNMVTSEMFVAYSNSWIISSKIRSFLLIKFLSKLEYFIYIYEHHEHGLLFQTRCQIKWHGYFALTSHKQCQYVCPAKLRICWRACSDSPPHAKKLCMLPTAWSCFSTSTIIKQLTSLPFHHICILFPMLLLILFKAWTHIAFLVHYYCHV